MNKDNHSNSKLSFHHKMEETFDKIVLDSAKSPYYQVLENNLNKFYSSEQVLFFQNNTSIDFLYCQSKMFYCPHGSGVIGFVQTSKQILLLTRVSNHASYSIKKERKIILPDRQVLMIPVFDTLLNLKGIIVVIRTKESDPFSDDDIASAEYFQKKIQLNSHWLFQPQVSDNIVSDFTKICNIQQFISTASEKLTELFNCKYAEIWRLNTETKQISFYNPKINEPIDLPISISGLPGFVLEQSSTISCVSVKDHISYSKKIDGNGNLSLLGIPYQDPNSTFTYSIILRGRKSYPFFINEDEQLLAHIIPHIVSSLSSLEKIQKGNIFYQNLITTSQSLAKINKRDDLIPLIFSSALKIVHADICLLYIVSENRNYIKKFNSCTEGEKELLIQYGIVGKVITSGKSMIVNDSTNNEFFDKHNDLPSRDFPDGHYSILSVPFFGEYNHVSGAIQLIHKNGAIFTEQDEQKLSLLCFYIGCSLDASDLYQSSLHDANQLLCFKDAISSFTLYEEAEKRDKLIVRVIRKAFLACYAAVYLVDNENPSEFKLYLHDIDALVKSRQKELPEEKFDEIRNFANQKVGDLLNDKDKNSILENHDDSPEKSLIAVRILNMEKQTIGAIVLQWNKENKKFTFEDCLALGIFSIFLSVSIDRLK